MAVVINENDLVFTYTFTVLNEKVQQLSARAAQAMSPAEGVVMVDKYAISDDEQDTIILKMKEAADQVFQYFGKLTYGITNAITKTDSSVELKIKKETGGNPNAPKEVDGVIEEALVNYILGEWFAIKEHMAQAQVYATAFNMNIREVLRLSAELRKPAI